MILFTSQRKLIEAIQDAMQQGLSAVELRKQISQLEIDRDKKLEEFQRREREVEHKIGLERKRQEFEIEHAQKSTEVKVREENLAADKQRFKEEMEFQRKHLQGEIDSLRGLVGNLLERLPSAKMMLKTTEKR